MGEKLEPKQPVDLDHEPTVRQLGPSVEHISVPILGVDDKELATGGPLPSQPNVGAEGIAPRVVLDESAQERTGTQAVGDSRPDHVLVELPVERLQLGQIDPVELDAGLEG